MKTHTEESYWENNPYKDSDFVFKQEILRGNVMYDRLTNPQKFAEYDKWSNRVGESMHAYRVAYEMLSSSKEHSKRIKKLADNKQEIEDTKMALFYLNKSSAGGYVQKISWLHSWIDKWNSENKDIENALEIIERVKKENIPISEIKEIHESLERKCWDMHAFMESGFNNDPSVKEFKDILKYKNYDL